MIIGDYGVVIMQGFFNWHRTGATTTNITYTHVATAAAIAGGVDVGRL